MSLYARIILVTIKPLRSMNVIPVIDHLALTCMALFRMRLINVAAFLKREELIKKGRPLNRQTNVFSEFYDDSEITNHYAIVSHRWTKEVNYEEINDLAKMEVKDGRDEIRRRDGYQKLLDSCEQAKRDRYEWLWMDTCCIDKRNSAELSEAINSMYRWYENSGVCYAYLHDLTDKIFPVEPDTQKYPSNGWPEWFSRGWTLQEMIAPRDVQFFNRKWQFIGIKTKLAPTLAKITRVPEHILTDGVRSTPPCVAQIISWAANRTTTRVEDRAYSLLGLLDVNMPMLYGEGKKAFRRLQLEIIRRSDDQSIFAWDYQKEEGRTCSILADDPRCFKDCSDMKLIDPVDFIKELKGDIEKQLSTDKRPDPDQLSVFPVTNRGIQIWLPLCPLDDSVFEAHLPCRSKAEGPPVTIKLVLWKRNYYRHFTPLQSSKSTPEFNSIYLRYQDILQDVEFEINDSALTSNGFEYRGTYPSNPTRNTLILTDMNPLYVEVYSNRAANLCLIVGYGKVPGQHWIHLDCRKAQVDQDSWRVCAQEEHEKMLSNSGQQYANDMIDACPRSERYRRLLVKHTSLPGSTRTVRTSCVVWESSRICAVKIDLPQPDSHLCTVWGKWIGFSIDVGGFLLVHMHYLTAL